VAYIGTQPLAGQYRKLDDISSGFNSATTSFTTSVGGTNVTAGSPQQLLVSLGGVIQQPTTDYTVNTSTIIFTTAPASGLSFFAILMGDALNTSVPADGSITSAKLAGSLSVGLAAGSASTPSLFFTGDLNTGIYSPGADQVAITTNGVERVEWGTSEVVFNDGGANYDFRIEGDTNSSLFFVDASAEAVGIGTTAPDGNLTIGGLTNTGGQSVDAINVNRTDGVRLFGVKWDVTSNEVRFSGNTKNYVFRNGSSEAETARIDSSGRLLVGTSTARGNFFNSTDTALVQVEGANNNAQRYAGHIYGVAGAGGPWHIFAKHRSNSIGGTTVVIADDQVGALSFQGSDGTEFVEAARIEALVDGTPGSNDMPGRIVLSTTADGASSPTERMRITNNGTVYINTTAAPNQSTFGTYFDGAAIGYFSSFRNVNGLSTVCAIGGTAGYAAVMGDGDLENTNNRYTGISDAKLKQNIEDASSQWDDIKSIQVRKYELIANPDRKHIGCVAQELEQVCPGLVIEREDKDGETYKSVAYSVLYMKAVKALQEAMERIEVLEQRLTDAGIA
jgi:hypothetical protein